MEILKTSRPVNQFRNSISTPVFTASIVNGKYVNAFSIERQAWAFKDSGINLATNTMASWGIKSAEKYLSLIYDRMHELIYDSKVIHSDESPVKCMRIDKTKIKNGKKTFMWVYRNNPHCSKYPIILYDWQLSRKASYPSELMHLDNCFDDLSNRDRKKQRQLIYGIKSMLILHGQNSNTARLLTIALSEELWHTA